MVPLNNNTYINIKIPPPVKKYSCGKTSICIYRDAREAGIASCLNVISTQIRLVSEKGSASMMLMAAPSACEFYKAYADLAASSSELQEAIKNTHYFQMDEYILPEDHPASFKRLLKDNFFNHIDKYTSGDYIHLLSGSPENTGKTSRQYAKLILEHGPDIQVKGQGEDGHWGFHQPHMSFEEEPKIVKVRLNIMNMSQQLRDHPGFYSSINDTPVEALTGNVSLFMKTRTLIEDIVPQASKAYAIVAAYANENIDAACPSGKLKQHENSIARLNIDSAWALMEYRQKGVLSAEAVYNLDKIWQSSGSAQEIDYKKRFMRESFKRLKIKYKDYQSS